jgi:predicted DCC family thiol-disulfide oxidoreductase YuxK
MAKRYAVLYDEQCEVCQAFVAWLRLLDRSRRVDCVPIGPASLAILFPDLSLEACLREIHVVTPQGDLRVGWDGVARLARLFPVTWPIGALGGLPGFRALGRILYRWVAANRYALSKCRGGTCRMAHLETVRRRTPLGAFWFCRMLGLLVRLPLVLGAGAARLAAQAATSMCGPTGAGSTCWAAS